MKHTEMKLETIARRKASRDAEVSMKRARFLELFAQAKAQYGTQFSFPDAPPTVNHLSLFSEKDDALYISHFAITFEAKP
jgi:hypothetical protein